MRTHLQTDGDSVLDLDRGLRHLRQRLTPGQLLHRPPRGLHSLLPPPVLTVSGEVQGVLQCIRVKHFDQSETYPYLVKLASKLPW